jgi:PhnB protein
VQDGAAALKFYQVAFDAVESYKLETPDGIIAKLSVAGAEFWISGSLAIPPGETALSNTEPRVRMILTVADPDKLFASAIRAGAKEIYGVREEHGWRTGKVEDPFGFHWEIGHPLEDS